MDFKKENNLMLKKIVNYCRAYAILFVLSMGALLYIAHDNAQAITEKIQLKK